MDSLTHALEETLITYQNGEAQPPPGVDIQEAVASIREELEIILLSDAKRFLESTKDLSPEDQLVSWRNWLYAEDGEIYPWRSSVYCELDTPTIPV